MQELHNVDMLHPRKDCRVGKERSEPSLVEAKMQIYNSNESYATVSLRQTLLIVLTFDQGGLRWLGPLARIA